MFFELSYEIATEYLFLTFSLWRTKFALHNCKKPPKQCFQFNLQPKSKFWGKFRRSYPQNSIDKIKQLYFIKTCILFYERNFYFLEFISNRLERGHFMRIWRRKEPGRCFDRVSQLRGILLSKVRRFHPEINLLDRRF